MPERGARRQQSQRPRLTQLITILLFLVIAPCSIAQRGTSQLEQSEADHTEGLLQSIHKARIVASGDDLLLSRTHREHPVELTFTDCQGLGIDRQDNQWWILPISALAAQISANKYLWVLPLDASSKEHSWQIELHNGDATATKTDAGLKVVLNTDSVTLHRSQPRPHSDPFGHSFSLDFPGGPELEDALAAFYWGTMLPSVVEKTMAAHFPYSSGYVLSTLKTSSYAGSYPAVDHEFQIKGRLAIGSEADLDVVKRMIELQLKLMSDDPERLSRAPTSVQPDGRREYHIRRNSMDRKQNAAMFPLTGNIEVLEEAWHYFDARKDLPWLRQNISRFEDAAAWTEASIDQYGRVWSDVYYEDQVIKDGRETQAQAFAAYTFGLLCRMEVLLQRQDKAAHYSTLSRKVAATLIQPLPMGYWDEKNQRFVDWVDRDGLVHDHIHLLANTLPVTFGYATPAQAEAVTHLVDQHAAQFERFPTFLSADIAAYSNSEIGDGGPYDLSAAGRYWYWDAAFRESRNENDLLFAQLKAVAVEAAKNNYFMGERYDMDFVYYVDGKNAHGAEQYYEYPNVFSAVLISKFLGLTIPADADVSITPHLTSYGVIDFRIPEYAVRYSYSKDRFVLTNLSDRPRRFKVNLSALGDGSVHYRLSNNASHPVVDSQYDLDVPAHADATWTAQP